MSKPDPSSDTAKLAALQRDLRASRLQADEAIFNTRHHIRRMEKEITNIERCLAIRSKVTNGRIAILEAKLTPATL